MTESQQQWIDNASYQTLLGKWRNDLAGSPWFEGDVGEYFSKVMNEKKDKLSHSEQVRASKNVGWVG